MESANTTTLVLPPSPPQVTKGDNNDVTHWRHVRYDLELGRPWIVREEPGRGYVAYATRSFQMGEKICSEFPTVWIHGHHPFDESQIQEIHDKVNALDAVDKEAFYAMANVFPEFPPAVGIFMTNCFDMTDSIYGTCCAMYLALARLNHSCYPNAQQTHIPSTTEEVLYAARTIEKGEEINDCYIDLRQSRIKRRHELQEYYRFYCTCQACQDPNGDNRDDENTAEHTMIEESPDFLTKVLTEDQLREKTSEISDTIVSLITGGDTNEEDINIDDEEEFTRKGCIAALTTTLQLKSDLLPISSDCNQLYTDQNNKNTALKWCIRYLPELYMSIFQLCESLVDNHYNSSANKSSKLLRKRFQSEALSHLQQARDLVLLLQGPTSPEYERLCTLFRDKQIEWPSASGRDETTASTADTKKKKTKKVPK